MFGALPRTHRVTRGLALRTTLGLRCALGLWTEGRDLWLQILSPCMTWAVTQGGRIVPREFWVAGRAGRELMN